MTLFYICLIYSFIALTASCAHGHHDMASWLIDQGANPSQPNGKSFSPLLCAVDSGKWDVADLLLGVGVDIEQVDKYGRTPLMISAYKGHIGVVEMLLARGRLINLIQIFIGKLLVMNTLL